MYYIMRLVNPMHNILTQTRIKDNSMHLKMFNKEEFDIENLRFGVKV